ncbi:hypothetical protein PPERSA_04017 [Pseudocohnilembus persalinus]|uniref:Uncharacterized protein n=1 Tax=Pseudocohnilembus persalinus TaxID=266149 RepID=A0A0V0QKS6_PSEPJ|nr:hypothetical protein PPERSA_04017 [Pseudocohnilembus persalinus]|eukprot:KRX02814.1 hypothetical protein PPERSA_04017 [Pseudocohnilembus persalinus]
MSQSVYRGAVDQNRNQLLSSVVDHFKSATQTGGFNKQTFYQQYNAKLQQQYRDLVESKGRDIYQKGVISLDSTQDSDQLLINPDLVNPLLKTLEEENVVLKSEIKTLSEDLKQFISMVQLLLEENKAIREHINQKNRDITKLIETVGLNDGEEVQDLKHKIHILTEENNILIKHLDEMKIQRRL